jgi:hypothetical protein
LGQRQWDITPNDILQVAISSSKDRYKCMAQTDAFAGVEIPCWLGCKHGRSITAANPMRLAFQLACVDGFNTISMVGQVTCKSNREAMAVIIGGGLRNDVDEETQQGRSAVVADPWGAMDVREPVLAARKRQSPRRHRRGGLVEHIGEQFYFRKHTGVRAFVAGGGAVLFASIDPHIATVIPCRVFRGIMMHHPVDDHFARQMRAAGVQDPEACGQNLETQYKTGWFNMWPPTLGAGCLPPADEKVRSQGQTLDVHYKDLVTIDDVTIPQMGIPNNGLPWLHASRTPSENRRIRLARDMSREIEDLVTESRSRIVELVESFASTIEDYDVDNAIRADLRPEFFLELKGAFAACPHCRHRDGWITPIRQGQLVCVRSQCWTIVQWRNAEQHVTADVVAFRSSREIIRDAREVGARRAHAMERSRATRTYRNTTRREGKRASRWDFGRPTQDGSQLPYMVAWATGEADRYRAKPYGYPLGGPDNAWDVPQFTWENTDL